MSHPRKRTWTLGTLSRDEVYGLFFDAAENRWEVVGLENFPYEVTRHIMASMPPMVPDGWTELPNVEPDPLPFDPTAEPPADAEYAADPDPWRLRLGMPHWPSAVT